MTITTTVTDTRHFTITTPVTDSRPLTITTPVIDTRPFTITTPVTDSEIPSHTSLPDKDSWSIGKGFSMLHLNIHFLYPKLDEIKLRNFDKQLDVLCFCETFLNDSFSYHELSINNYNLFRRDRGAIGGGLVIYVKDFYHCTRRSDLESISLECICSEIKQQYLNH